MPVDRVDSCQDPRVGGYLDLKDRHQKRRAGCFVVEGRVNLRVLLEDSPYRPQSILLGEPAWRALSDVIERHAADVPVYLAPPDVLQSIVGFAIHRGCLALVERPAEATARAWIEARPAGRSVVLALEGLTNHDNVGGLFRNAMAFGVDGVLLSPDCCDPLYRKAIRTSMGGSLCVPHARDEAWPDALGALRETGHRVVALDPQGECLLGRDAAGFGERFALVVGTEGAGLSDAVREGADVRLRIGMMPGVDSLNVATSAAIALHAACGPAIAADTAIEGGAVAAPARASSLRSTTGSGVGSRGVGR